MKKPMTLLSVLVFALVLAACGEAAEEDTTTTSAPETTTTTVADATTTTEAEDTTTTSTADEPEASGDLARLQAAMSDSAEASPSRIEGAISVQLPDGEAAEMPMSMKVDPETGDSSMSMDMAAMAQATGETDDIPPEMAEMMGSMEVREIGDTVYLSFPFFTAFLGAETEWVSMPAEDEDMADEMTSGPTPDNPGHFLESFSDTDGTVEELGSEEIRGISATHYRLTVDEDWQDELSEEELSELDEQGPLPDSSFPIDLWVGEDGLVHRMSIDIQAEDFAGTEGDEIEGMSMTFDFFDFGESVTIEAPPADQVTDISDLSGPMGTFEP